MSSNSKEARRRHHIEVLITMSSLCDAGRATFTGRSSRKQENVDHAAAAQVKDKCNVTYLSQISFGMITSSLSSHLFVAGLSWLIRFKLLARYLKMVSSSDGLSPSRNSCSLRRIRWLQIIVCLVSAQWLKCSPSPTSRVWFIAFRFFRCDLFRNVHFSLWHTHCLSICLAPWVAWELPLIF